MLPWTHPSTHPKRHLDRFSRFCTAHGRVSLYFTMCAAFPLKIAPSHGGALDPCLIYGSLTRYSSPQPKRHLDRSRRFAGLTIVTDRPTDSQTTLLYNEKQWNSAYLRQGTSYQCHDPDPDPDPWSGSPPKFNLCSLVNLPSKFHANPFCAKFLTDRQTNNDDYIASLAEVTIGRICVRITGWRLGVVASVIRRMNEVTVHWARLVLGWVTVFGRVYHHGM